MLPRLKEISSPAKYGLYQSLEGLVSMLSRQCDQLIILKFLGAEILGIYSYIKDLIGKPLLQLINPIINRLLFPLLVKLPFSERRAFYMRSLLVLSTFTMPLYLGLAYFSEPFLIFILNNSWGEHHLVASLLALTYLMMAMITPCSSLLQAMGAVKRSFYWNVAVTIIRVSVIFASVPFGIEVMLGALLILQAFILFAHWYVLIRPMIHISLFSFFKVPSIPLTLAVIIIFISSILQPLMSIDEFWQAILYAFVVIISLVISVYLLKSRIHIIDKLVQR
jgi:O-antigen/teichoic acid export membrane protein